MVCAAHSTKVRRKKVGHCQRLRIILFQSISQPVGEVHPLLHQPAPLLNQRHQRAHLEALWLERQKCSG